MEKTRQILALTERQFITVRRLSGDRLALSVTFGDSSPKGRALGKEGRLCGMQKPLPLGEVSAQQTERARTLTKKEQAQR